MKSFTMRPGPKISPTELMQVFLVLVLLCIVLNPELRALIYFVDAIGLEVAILLLVLQARALSAMVPPMLDRLAAVLCKVAIRAGTAALYLYPTVARLPTIRKLICPILVGMTYGVRCHESSTAV